jgi:hypothetical protein
MPGLGVGDQVEGADAAGHDRGREQQCRADPQLQGRTAEGRANGSGELDVGRRLDREQRTHQEQKGNRHGLHVT